MAEQPTRRREQKELTNSCIESTVERHELPATTRRNERVADAIYCRRWRGECCQPDDKASQSTHPKAGRLLACWH